MKTLIPLKLRKLIENSRYSGGVQQTFDRFVPLLGNTNTGLYFFPEFTDHGPEHIAGVLASATKLIPNKVWKLLTPEDGVLIALSALLHDVAMVLTADGLMNLLSTERAPTIEAFDEKSWTTLFEDFFSDARRWDDRRVFRILGDKDNREIVNLRKDIVHVRERPDSEEWSGRYRKFLGEFVRWHHARLAHEIACAGFPGSSPLTVTGISPELADIAGLVARSHNLNPRQTYEYLDHKYDGHIVCRGMHPIYAMVLLRVADYLQLDSNRRNASWNTVQRLRSPISQDEWNAHLSVKEIRPDDADPEALFISAVPESAANFLKIKKLLGGLQYELDLSWAVLAEVYGRSPESKDYAITLRRIRSNIDDEREFIRKHKPAYFPTRAVFDTAGASLLNLLIRPLYGDRPQVGIRELIQNSVDAVRELDRLRETHPTLGNVKTIKQKPDVLVSISKNSDGKYVLQVSDKGVGMTFATVRDYFLKAGVSFRQSDTWQKQFVENDKPTVLRSGRFGIGALAAFLLGDRLKVTTRSVWSEPEEAVSFEARIEDDSIELKRLRIDEVGTRIEITLSEDTAGDLNKNEETWDWFVFEKPVVTRTSLGKELNQQLTIPIDSYSNWCRVFHPDYREIIWSYVDSFSHDDDDDSEMELVLACNGIRVHSGDAYPEDYEWGPDARDMPFDVPTVSVIDYSAALPLTLQRASLETTFFPFHKELAEEVTRDYCAYVLTHGPSTFFEAISVYPRNYEEWSAFPQISFVSTSEGTMLFHPWHVRQAGLRRLFASSEEFKRFDMFANFASPISAFSVESIDLNAVRQGLKRISRMGSPLVGIRLLISNVLMSNENFYFDFEEFRALNRTHLEFAVLCEGGYLATSRQDVMKVYEGIPDFENRPIFCLEALFEPANIETDSPFTHVWQDIMGNAVVPFDLNERQRKFKRAYEELSEYIALWTDPQPGTWRHKLLERHAEQLNKIPKLSQT